MDAHAARCESRHPMCQAHCAAPRLPLRIDRNNSDDVHLFRNIRHPFNCSGNQSPPPIQLATRGCMVPTICALPTRLPLLQCLELLAHCDAQLPVLAGRQEDGFHPRQPCRLNEAREKRTLRSTASWASLGAAIAETRTRELKLLMLTASLGPPTATRPVWGRPRNNKETRPTAC